MEGDAVVPCPEVGVGDGEVPAAVPDRRERKDDASPFHGSCRQIFRKIGTKRIIGLFHTGRGCIHW